VQAGRGSAWIESSTHDPDPRTWTRTRHVSSVTPLIRKRGN